MTVEIEYQIPTNRELGKWQISMAELIESNRGFPISDIYRQTSGTTLIVSVETTLPDSAVDNMLSDIEDYLPAGSQHIETREV